MDHAYYVLLGVFTLGAVLGFFLNSRVVRIFVGGVLAILFTIFGFGVVTESEKLVWLTGFALMAAPVLGLVVWVGVEVGDALATRLGWRQKAADSKT